MNFVDCTYNEDRDIQSVEQIGFIDLAEAVSNGYVPASVDSDDMVYNEIEDPASIMHRASDVFELYRQADYIKGYHPATSNEEQPTEQG